MVFKVRPYMPADETGWVRCRALAFLDSAYYDNVYTAKERYENPAVELVAEAEGQIVGLLDVEYEREPGTVAYRAKEDPREGLGAVIHHVAVHPDYRRHGIASRLLEAALAELRRHGVAYVEAWTRDDEAARRWYEAHGFRIITSYWHVYADGPEEMEGAIDSQLPGLHVRYAFAHYLGDDGDMIRRRFRRVHSCCMYRRDV